ncbi:allantoinase [Ascobolus immersus RN42]|uniref:allantoinase n=1 Tax=Ascobolus immersus RN42 TaxID=1160509 RepID=A0A3N4IFZ3_ASCIM|nr:allantoinase [Ascobolus immersus RN42]
MVLSLEINSGAAELKPQVFVSSRVVLGERVTPGTIVFSSTTGKILSIHSTILPESAFPPGTPYTDHTPHVIMPGLVDAHVHLNEPGRTEWEGFETGSRAAAFGGVTTIIDMPLNAIPPTTTIENLETKKKAAQGKCWVDVGFYGGIIPGNEKDLVPLVKAGVRGFKCFLIESGVEEFPAVSSEDVEKAMLELKDQPTVMMFHAEMIPPITASVSDVVQHSDPPLAPSGPLNSYKTFLDSRPPALETYALAEILSCAPVAPNLPLHIVHLSATECLPILAEARANGVNITAETCFHYLALHAEAIEDGDTRHKCCPPIREKNNQDGLWEALRGGLIETVVSDHSPCTAGLKQLNKGDFFSAWGGISTVGLGLSVLWTEGAPRGVTLPEIVNWCAYKTSKQVGLLGKKGSLEVGWDADICVFDDEGTFTVTSDDMKFKNKVTPYESKELRGIVRETWLRGERVFSRGDGFEEKVGARGQLLLEPRTA